VFQVHAKGAPGAATLTGINQGFVSGDVIPADDDCFDAIVQVKFNGGFGRFRNATGTATIRLTSKPVGFVDNGSWVVPSKLLSEVGTITGRLYR